MELRNEGESPSLLHQFQGLSKQYRQSVTVTQNSTITSECKHDAVHCKAGQQRSNSSKEAALEEFVQSSRSDLSKVTCNTKNKTFMVLLCGLTLCRKPSPSHLSLGSKPI